MHRPMFRITATLLLVLATACADDPTTAGAPAAGAPPTLNNVPLAPASQYGMNANPCHGSGDSTCLHRELDNAQSAGVRWIRMAAYWYIVQPNGGSQTDPNWNATVIENLQRTVRMAHRRGIQTNLILFGTPDWARLCGHPDVPDCGSVTSPPHEGMWVAWAYFAAHMADAFPTVTHFSIWNEPNVTSFFTPHPGHTANQDYYTLVAYAAAPLHDRGRFVVAGETAPHENMRAFIRDLMHGSGHQIDVLGVHHYNSATNIISWINEIPGLMDQAGRPRIPIWLTEYGHGVEHAGDADQAAVLTKVLDAMNSGAQPLWQKSFPFAMNFTGFRLADFNPDGTTNYIRPAWYCYQSVAFGYSRSSFCNYDSGT